MRTRVNSTRWATKSRRGISGTRRSQYTSTDGRWEAKGWIRNIQDDENITGKYLTSDTSGFYRNYFLTEPRIYGATVKYNFGALQ